MKVNLEVYSQRGLQIFQSALNLPPDWATFLGSEHLLWLWQKRGTVCPPAEKYGLDDKMVEEYICRYDGSAAGIKSRAVQLSGEADQVLSQAQEVSKAEDMRRRSRRIFWQASWLQGKARLCSSSGRWG